MRKLKHLGLGLYTSALLAIGSVYGQSEKDTLDLGFGVQGYTPEMVQKTIDNMNSKLDGIHLNISESPQLAAKTNYKSRELNHLMKNSFEKPHDIYFAWSTKQHDDKELAVESQYDKRVTFIDGSIKPNRLEDVLSFEVAKHLSTNGENPMRREASFYEKDHSKFTQNTYGKAQKRKLVSRLHKQQEEIKELPNLDNKTITYNLVLNEFDHELAKDIMKEVATFYKNEFGLTLEQSALFNYDERSITSGKQLERYSQKQNKSDMTIALTTNNWETKRADNSRNTLGQYETDTNTVWAEVTKYEQLMKREDIVKLMTTRVAHEKGHYLGADHNMLHQELMNGFSGHNALYMGPQTKQQIANHLSKK